MKKFIVHILIVVLALTSMGAYSLEEIKIINSINSTTSINVSVKIFACNSHWICASCPVASSVIAPKNEYVITDKTNSDALSIILQHAMRKTKGKTGTHMGCPRFIIEAEADGLSTRHHTVVLDGYKHVVLNIQMNENGLIIVHSLGSKHEVVVNKIAKQYAALHRAGVVLPAKRSKPLAPVSRSIMSFLVSKKTEGSNSEKENLSEEAKPCRKKPKIDEVVVPMSKTTVI